MMRRKPLLAVLALLAVLTLVAAGCGSDDDSETTDDTGEESSDGSSEDSGSDDSSDADTGEEAAGPEADEEDTTAGDDGETIRIAVVAPSASNDLAFTQSMVDSLITLGESRDIEVDITDGTFVVEDAAAAIRGYAEDGYDLVIAHGSQYGAPLEEIAGDFPEVSFAWGTTADTFGLDNVFAYTTRADEGGYVMGAMAAELTASGTIGVIGPVDVGDAALYVDGFEAGVAAQNPDATVNVNWTDDFSNTALAAEAAQSLLANGADVLTGTAQMVVGATGVAAEDGIPWFGTQSNQTSLGEENVVASQVYHWEVILEEMLVAMAGGTAGGESYSLTFENGGLVMEYNDGFDLAEEIRTVGEDATAGLADGTITTGVE
jgi:basic membrane protein A